MICSLVVASALLSQAPCAATMPGMACVAGDVSVGTDDGPTNERPRRPLTFLPFLIDTQPVPQREHARCVAAGFCPKRPPGKKGQDEAAAVVDFESGKKLCLFLGKELPTEWQWEAAASQPPLASLVDERAWTASWAGAASPLPCKGCVGTDPTGICGATDPCSRGGDHKVVRGGPATTKSSRKAAPLSAKAAVRCALMTETLQGFPTVLGTTTRPQPPTPTPPTDAQRAAAHAVTDDELAKKTCEKQGRSFMDCRDPASYIKTNEPRSHVWRPYVTNLGGGYTGVGIDQNYTLIAAQRAEWAWLFDYDPTIVRLHRVLKAMILVGETRAQFIAMFDDKHIDEAKAAIDKTWAGHPDKDALYEVYRYTRRTVRPYYERQLDGLAEDKTWGWLASEEAYAYVRLLYQQDRIVILKGDMLASAGMQSIAKAAKAVGVPIRIYYPSNAPEFWPHSQQYKDNVLALPMDQTSVVAQTSSGVLPGFRNKKGYWHYNIQGGLAHQGLMRRNEVVSVRQLMSPRHMTDDPDLTICNLPRTP